MTELKKGMYRHFKGNLYLVTGTARHTETEETLVIYQAIDGGKVWARPLSMFLESVDGKPRFEYAKELQERRKQPEIIFCKDCTKHNKTIGDFEYVFKEKACPMIAYRGKAQGHEFDYQFCSCAERREGRTDE